MTTLSIYEVRRLVLPTETVVEAVLQFDRDSAGTLWQGTCCEATVESEPSPGLLVSVRMPRSGAIERRTFGLPVIAAAIINYCRQARIPLPRNGKKTLEVVPEGFAFCIQTTIKMPRWHSAVKIQPQQAAKAAPVSGTQEPEQAVLDPSAASPAEFQIPVTEELMANNR